LPDQRLELEDKGSAAFSVRLTQVKNPGRRGDSVFALDMHNDDVYWRANIVSIS
jgi:hypothetical protein